MNASLRRSVFFCGYWKRSAIWPWKLQGERVGGAAREVVQVRADAQQEVVGALQGAALALVDEALLGQLGEVVHPLLEIEAPEQVVVIAQAARDST